MLTPSLRIELSLERMGLELQHHLFNHLDGMKDVVKEEIEKAFSNFDVLGEVRNVANDAIARIIRETVTRLLPSSYNSDLYNKLKRQAIELSIVHLQEELDCIDKEKI